MIGTRNRRMEAKSIIPQILVRVSAVEAKTVWPKEGEWLSSCHMRVSCNIRHFMLGKAEQPD